MNGLASFVRCEVKYNHDLSPGVTVADLLSVDGPHVKQDVNEWAAPTPDDRDRPGTLGNTQDLG